MTAIAWMTLKAIKKAQAAEATRALLTFRDLAVRPISRRVACSTRLFPSSACPQAVMVWGLLMGKFRRSSPKSFPPAIVIAVEHSSEPTLPILTKKRFRLGFRRTNLRLKAAAIGCLLSETSQLAD